MDLAQSIEFEENFRPKLESKEGLLHIKEEKIDPTKNLSSVGKEIVRMDFDQTIVFEENIQPKLESKERLLCIKEETIDSTEEKLKFLASAEKDLSVDGKEIDQMDFAQTIKFEENIKPKLESKEGLFLIKKEKIDPTKDLSCIGKEIVEMDFHQTIEFEENIKPKLESKEGILRIKEEKIDSTEEKLKFLASGEKDLSNIGKDIVRMDFSETIEFEEDMKPKLESKEGLLLVKDDLDSDDLDSASRRPNIISDRDVLRNMVETSTEADGDDLDFSLDEEDDIPDFDETVKNMVKNVPEVGKQFQTELDQVHQDHLMKNLSLEKSLTDLKEKNSILQKKLDTNQQEILAQTEVILEKMEIIDNLHQNGAKERSHLSIRRENVELKRSIKELEAINAVQSPAAKEVRKIRNSLIAKIQLGTALLGTDDNELENMQTLDILSLLQKYDKKLTTAFSKKNATSDTELEKLKAKIVRLKAKNKELKNKARTESLTLKND